MKLEKQAREIREWIEKSLNGFNIVLNWKGPNINITQKNNKLLNLRIYYRKKNERCGMKRKKRLTPAQSTTQPHLWLRVINSYIFSAASFTSSRELLVTYHHSSGHTLQNSNYWKFHNIIWIGKSESQSILINNFNRNFESIGRKKIIKNFGNFSFKILLNV